MSEAWGTRDASRLGERLAELGPTNLPTDLGPPLETALGLLAQSADPNREIYIISDMQRSSWERVAGLEGGRPASARVLVVDLGEAVANACVADASLRIPSGSDDLDLEVTFEEHNSSGSQGRVAEVYLKGDLLARSVFSPGGSGRERETFRLPSLRGFSWGEIALAEDRLRIDDKRYFAVPSRQRSVGLVGQTYYVSRALSPEGVGSITLSEIAEGALGRSVLAGLDLLVVSDVARFSPLEVDALADYVAAGGALLVFLGGRADIGDYNRNLLPRLAAAGRADGAAETAPPRIEGAGVGSVGGDPANRGFFTVDRVDRSHPVFAKFKADESPFGDARFYTYLKIEPGAGRTLASFSDGSPAVLELGSRVMLVASSADVAWNDLVLAPQFVPILHEAILHLTTEATPRTEYAVGADITVTGDQGALEATLDGPRGSSRLFPETVAGGARYRIDSPADPGVYFLRSDGETLAVFAVNVDTRESDLTKAAPSEVSAALDPLEVKMVAAPDDVGESISLMRKGRDLSRWMLWGALGFLLAETLLASTLALRPSRTEGQDALSDS